MRPLYRVQVTLHVECQTNRFLSKQLNCKSKPFKTWNYDVCEGVDIYGQWEWLGWPGDRLGFGWTVQTDG